MRVLSIRADSVEVLDAVPAARAEGETLWCDCSYDEARVWVAPLERLTGVQVFDDHLKDAESPQHPSYFESTHAYELVIFRGLATGAGVADGDVPIRLRTRPTVFFVLPGCLVTVSAQDGTLVASLRERLLAAPAGRQRLPDSPEELMLRLLNAMVDRYLDLRQPLTEQLDRWQRQLLDPRRPFRDWTTLLDARTNLRRLEQLCEEQLDALQEWRDERAERPAAGAGILALPARLEVRANDLVNHIHRVLNHARRLQEAIESAVQLHFSSTAYRTNEVMRTLTAITAVFMPLTLITGIFGMNFEFIPGLHTRAGFWITIGGMAALSAALLGWFSARRYFGTQAIWERRRQRGGAAGRERRAG